MRRSKKQVAKKLAESHFQTDPHLKHIFLLTSANEDDPEEPIKLLEVVEGTLERGVEPIGFAADPARGIDYRSVIVEISPREYGNGNLRRDLKHRGWQIGEELMAS